MSYDAKAIEIMIASPSDVVEERQVVRDIIAEWNAVNSRHEGVCLLPLGWETHTSPELSGRPQELINESILKHADILVGMFWTRVGSPTGKSISGSIEEIEEHRKAGKPALLYFSEAPIPGANIDIDQIKSLEEFKEWAKREGLVETYKGPRDFAEKFRRHLQLTLLKHHIAKEEARPVDAPVSETIEETVETTSAELSGDARAMLLSAAESASGHIVVLRHLGGTHIGAGDKDFAQECDARSVARWTAAVEELYECGLTRDINGKGEIFELNHRGYETADALKGSTSA